jgi:hypothetical protein
VILSGSTDDADDLARDHSRARSLPMLPLRYALFNDPLIADEAEVGWLMARVPPCDPLRDCEDRPDGENDPQGGHGGTGPSRSNTTRRAPMLTAAVLPARTHASACADRGA